MVNIQQIIGVIFLALLGTSATVERTKVTFEVIDPEVLGGTTIVGAGADILLHQHARALKKRKKKVCGGG